MKKLLLIMGDLASGKSTFAKKISKCFNIPYFSKDTIKEVLGDTIGFTNREENLKLSKATMQIIKFIFRTLSDLKQDLILEANFHTNELEELHSIAMHHDYQVLTLVFRGKVEILHKRYLKRITDEYRHPVHLSTTFDVFEDFEKYILVSRKEKIIGESIIVQADDFAYQEDEKLLRKLDNFFCQNEN